MRRRVATVNAGAVRRMVHDMRNVLSVANCCTAMLLDSASPEALDDVGDLRAALEQLSRMVEHLYGMSIGEKNNGSSCTLKDALALAKPLVADLGQRVYEERIARDIPPIAMPAHELARVLTNILDNACKATVPRALVSVEAHAMQGGRYALVRIHDTGSGMDKATVEMVAKPGYTTREAGSGIGLTVVADVVSSCGGRWSIHSMPNVGTIVELKLPVAEGAS